MGRMILCWLRDLKSDVYLGQVQMNSSQTGKCGTVELLPKIEAPSFDGFRRRNRTYRYTMILVSRCLFIS